MSEDYIKADYYYQTSEPSNGTFSIWGSYQGEQPIIGGKHISFSLVLKQGTTVEEADELAATMRKYVKETIIHLS